jgi:AraC-like DNA-binding protein
MDMRGPMRLVSLVNDVEWQRHIRDAVGPSSIIRWIHTESDLDASDGLANANAVLWHLAPSPHTAATLGSTFRKLRVVMPLTPIVLYCQVAPAVAQLMLLAARLGVHRAALRGYDDLGRVLADTLYDYQYGNACEEILRHLRLGDSMVPVMAYCLRHAFDGVLSVDRLARAFQVDRKTLHNHLRRGGLPTAAALISWSRLLAAGWLFEDRQHTVSSVARALRFSSASELRGMLSRYVHRTATEVRSVGALTEIASVFQSDCTRYGVSIRGRKARGTSDARASHAHTFVTSPPKDGTSPLTD